MAIALPAAPLVRGSQRRLLSLPQSTPMRGRTGSAFSLVLVVTLVAVAVPLLAPHDPLVPVGMPLQAPGKNGFLLGTDSVGRDILSRVLYGVRSSWFAALVVVAVGLLIGGLVGLIAGADGRLGRHRADAHHRRVPVAARTRAGDRRGRRARTRLRPHPDRGVDRLVAVLRHGWSAARWPDSPPAHTSRPRSSPGWARFGSPAGTCFPARCPTRWWPPASTSAR